MIFVNDVALEVDSLFCDENGCEPCGIIFLCVFQEANAVTTNERCSRRPREGLIGKIASEGRCFVLAMGRWFASFQVVWLFRSASPES